MTRVRFPSPAPEVRFSAKRSCYEIRPFGSVVEHSLGKGEVAGPIPAKGTSFGVAAGRLQPHLQCVDLSYFSESKNGKRKIHPHQAARERRHDRSRRPRQDHADGGDRDGAVDQVRRRSQGLRPDRRGARRKSARHHHQHRPRRVRNGQPPLRARGLPRPRRLRQEHDHRRRPDGRRHPGVLGRRRPDAPDPRAHPAGPPGGRAATSSCS